MIGLQGLSSFISKLFYWKAKSFTSVKHKLFIYLFLITHISCAQQVDEYKFEDQLIACFYSSHQTQGIEIRSAVDELERLFIAYDVLRDRSGEAYIELLERVKNEEDIGLNNPLLRDKIRAIENVPFSLGCWDSAFITEFDTAGLFNSKPNQLFTHLSDTSLFNFKIMAEDALEILSPQDFEHDFYRTTALVF